jgi:hypothetical protein
MAEVLATRVKSRKSVKKNIKTALKNGEEMMKNSNGFLLVTYTITPAEGRLKFDSCSFTDSPEIMQYVVGKLPNLIKEMDKQLQKGVMIKG